MPGANFRSGRKTGDEFGLPIAADGAELEGCREGDGGEAERRA